jgi:hypothetical protein
MPDYPPRELLVVVPMLPQASHLLPMLLAVPVVELAWFVQLEPDLWVCQEWNRQNIEPL